MNLRLYSPVVELVDTPPTPEWVCESDSRQAHHMIGMISMRGRIRRVSLCLSPFKRIADLIMMSRIDLSLIIACALQPIVVFAAPVERARSQPMPFHRLNTDSLPYSAGGYWRDKLRSSGVIDQATPGRLNMPLMKSNEAGEKLTLSYGKRPTDLSRRKTPMLILQKAIE